MTSSRIIIVATILLGTFWSSSSWVLPKHSQLPVTRRYHCRALESRPDIFFEDESDCPDEEECEIDWGAMPGFEDDDNSEEITSDDKDPTSAFQDWHLIGEETDELEPQEPYVPQLERSLDKSRTILEMNWQIENCEVDEDTCTDFCSECAGSGKSHCKFCRGTQLTSFGNEFRPCKICVDGVVDCSACAGTGSISPWAKTHDGNK